MVIACLCAAPAARAQAPAEAPPVASADSAGLGPTSDVPWNPDRPVGGRLPWETAVLFPARLLTLPLSALGQLSRVTLLEVEESSVVPRLIVRWQALARAGLAVGPASLGDRTGVGGRVFLTPPQLGRHLELEYGGTTRDYNSTRVAVVAGPARLEFRHDWRPQDRFHGLGMSSRLDDTTNFSSSQEVLTLSLARTWVATGVGGPARLSVRAWGGGRGLDVGRGREPEISSIEATFPGAGGSPYFVGGSQWLGGVSFSVDTRSGRPHWSRGERLSVAYEVTADRDDPTLLLHETSGNALADYRRVTAEFQSGVSFWRDPRTFRLFLRADRLDPRDDARTVAVPDLPALGGSSGLSGFEPGRWHDHAAVLARLSYIFPLAQHFEMDAHVEAGGVFPDLSAARSDALETSYGLMLRPRTAVAPLGAMGVEWSRESVRIRYTIGGVE